MAFHVNNLQADNLHEMSSFFCHQNEKITQNVLSATNCAWCFKGYNILVCLSSLESLIETFLVNRNESRHEISNNVVCATDCEKPQISLHIRSLIRALSYLLCCNHTFYGAFNHNRLDQSCKTTTGRRQSKTLITLMNIDKKSLETEFDCNLSTD